MLLRESTYDAYHYRAYYHALILIRQRRVNLDRLRAFRDAFHRAQHAAIVRLLQQQMS